MNQTHDAHLFRAQDLQLNSEIELPLIVDLDGTLLLTDTLHESAALFLKRRPFFSIFLMAWWLLQGKSVLKDKLAKNTNIRPELLPYNIPFLDWLNLEHKKGRKLILCTAANHQIASRVSSYIGIFDDVISSSATQNLIGSKKIIAIKKRYSELGFVYAGNSSDDLTVWKHASESILVNASEQVKKSLNSIVANFIEFPRQKINGMSLLRLLRLHQWSKNLLIFLPILAAHQLHHFESLALLLGGFISLGLCASSTYILNDIFDLESDRLHPRKKLRPFASGEIPIHFSSLILLMFPLSVYLANLVGEGFLLTILLYTLITLLYSFGLKSIVILDCIILAALYTIRIVAGAVIISNNISFWLLAFSVSLFFSLAFLKRYAEILNIQTIDITSVHGRGYVKSDQGLILPLGISSGMGSVVVMMLYLNSPEILALYSYTPLVWGTIPVLLFWISHMWFQAHRGNMHDDPVFFAITDKVSIITALIFFVFIFLAAYEF